MEITVAIRSNMSVRLTAHTYRLRKKMIANKMCGIHLAGAARGGHGYNACEARCGGAVLDEARSATDIMRQEQVLTVHNMNQRLRRVRYAVRGPVLERALQIEHELEKVRTTLPITLNNAMLKQR